jgi:uncharacterized membrane protein YkvI
VLQPSRLPCAPIITTTTIIVIIITAAATTTTNSNNKATIGLQVTNFLYFIMLRFSAGGTMQDPARYGATSETSGHLRLQNYAAFHLFNVLATVREFHTIYYDKILRKQQREAKILVLWGGI